MTKYAIRRRCSSSRLTLGIFSCVLVAPLLWAPCALAQDDPSTAQTVSPEAGMSPDTLRELAAEAAANRAAPPAPQPDALKSSSLNVLELLRQGGGIMLLIAIISLLVLAVALERLLNLRRGKLLPRSLRREIRRASDDAQAFQPQELYSSSQRYGCVAARILRDMLLKLGRPLPEVEAAIAEGSQREADRLYGNVRWLTLAAAVTPLIGLLGTVWGMIIAFHDTTQLGAGSNKAEYLAEGIYVALVTTLGGLAVAIPAAVFAHYFEGRITKMLASIDLELRKLLPRFESLEGQVRYDVSPQGLKRREGPREGLPRRSSQDRELRAIDGGQDDVAVTPPIRPTARRT